MLTTKKDFEKIFKKLNIKKKDNISVVSNSLGILIYNKKKKKKFKVENILLALKKIVSINGLIMIDAFNWDFCKKKIYDYKNSTNSIGALAKSALKDNEFVRSNNPIYSFLIYGKNQKKLSNLKHETCFGMDSPFGKMIKNNGKCLIIDLDFRASAYVHVAEQLAKVEYRFFKVFRGVIIKDGKKKKTSTKMFCRDLRKKVDTYTHPSFKEVLLKNNAIKEIKIKNVLFTLIELKKAHRLILSDLKNNRKYTYPIKIK
tara:strand:+ start:93 stop:866 length:774 start_codon:yes stop_codon:yes gene_type:complete